MEKVTFSNSMKRSSFKKYVNYKLGGRAKLTRFSSYKSKVVIFEVTVNKGSMLFFIDNCEFMDARINGNGVLCATFTCSVEKLSYILNEIDFFRRNPDSAKRMGFPNI